LPSLNLLIQSAVSGILLGGLYGLIGLGLGLSWGFLGQINLSHFAFVFLSAYLSFELVSKLGIDPLICFLVFPPIFFFIGVGIYWLTRRFKITPFNSLLLTFGLTVIIESLIQWVWTADFQKLQTSYGDKKVAIFGIYFPFAETMGFFISVFIATLIYVVMKRTDLGKAVRAIAQDPQMATAYGIPQKKISLGIAGLCTALAAIGGVCVAMIYTLNPSQMYTWIGVIFAVVMLGGLGNPFGPLLAGMVIGFSEAVTMVFVNPSWAPIVSFSLLIALLIFRPGKL
jgi:branched-chain amino acid transport system permease protein